jgi:hypothetical protein
MDRPSGSFPGSQTRVSDAERDQAVAELSEHFQAGRLMQEEFDDRSGRALQARTRGDLSVLFVDLPRRTAPAPAAPAPAAPGPAVSPAPALGLVGMRAGRLPVARVLIGCVLAVTVAANVLGGHGHVHAGLGWLLPAAIACVVVVRLAGRR